MSNQGRPQGDVSPSFADRREETIAMLKILPRPAANRSRSLQIDG